MNQAQRLVRLAGRFKNHVTPLLALTEGLVLGGGLLLVVDHAIRGDALSAVGALALTLAAALLTWKLHTTGVAVGQLRTLLKHAPAPAPQVTVVPAPAPQAPDPREKLNTIGTFTPETIPGAESGRIAAAVTTDPDAPFRLLVATKGASGGGAAGRSLALVGSDGLAQALAGHCAVHRIHPSMSQAEFVSAAPEILVIEEDALNGGAWDGALAPQGSQLLLELRVAMASIRAAEGFIYVIPTRGMQGMAAEAMRADTVLVDDEFAARFTAEDAPDSLLKTLGNYRLGVPAL
ncbi:hypothetical protein SAMN02745244_00933 [Tessaracoccus bendigoensis DSM 12906]|uniref:Uncharacterized protein n=1 Tax=Tessaracoccus bendigoensis DSM 12906 TaxID=1123357 RepID=A0A1M6DJ15_9ACTN|nr:hypothetical protein [Tessaracoccus bendigoensis]SHI73195.1 hypothetical protein SAMN02745244_00933 [Tessaracoccus bendigoensis DSM 12906]